MGSDADNYKRAEDQKWRELTNDRVISLTASETVQNDRLTDHDEELAEIKTILHGIAGDRHDNGMKGDIHALTVLTNELRAIMMPDHLGQGGVIRRLKALEQKAGLEEKVLPVKLTVIGSIIVAIVSSIALVLTNLDHIEPVVKKFFAEKLLIDSPRKAKHSSRGSKRRTVVKPEKENDDVSADEKMPE